MTIYIYFNLTYMYIIVNTIFGFIYLVISSKWTLYMPGFNFDFIYKNMIIKCNFHINQGLFPVFHVIHLNSACDKVKWLSGIQLRWITSVQSQYILPISYPYLNLSYQIILILWPPKNNFICIIYFFFLKSSWYFKMNHRIM